MLSFHNDPQIKDKFLKRLYAHAEADEFVHGKYWENGKGCAVGCTVHSFDHRAYETELGIPEWLARLEDNIFEGLGNGDAKFFAVRFLEVIPVGVELEPVKWEFCVFILRENIDRVLSLDIPNNLKTKVVDAIRMSLAIHETAIQTGEFSESAAQSAAWSVKSAAQSAAWSAAWSAAYRQYADKLLELLTDI